MSTLSPSEIPSLDQRPVLPKELLEKSDLQASLFILFSVAMYLLPSAGAYLIWDSETPRWLAIPPMILLWLFSQQGLHLLGWVGHEGFHLGLHSNKYASAVLGIFFSSIVPSFMQIGAAISHWNHHRYTNQPLDPDVQLFVPLKSFWSRLFLGRIRANRTYVRNALRMALGLPLDYPYKMPFSDKTVKQFARLNIAFSLLWLAVYVLVIVHDPVAGMIFIVIPVLFSFVYTGLRSFIEHAGTGEGLFRDTRTRRAPFLTFFYYGNNYHLEHHLYPMAPCYRLPAIHRYLHERGYFDGEGLHIEDTVLGAYRWASGKHQYPSGNAKTSGFDPLLS